MSGDRHGNRAWMISNSSTLLNSLLLPPEYSHSVSGVLQIERSSDRKSRSGSCRQSLPAFLFALSSSASRGSSAFVACLRARIGSFLPALVAFAAAPCDDIDQIVTAVIVGNLGACSDVSDGAYDDFVAYSVGLGIGPARMICVASEVLSARPVDRPTAVDLAEIAVASGLKLSACSVVSLRPLYSTMKAPFLTGTVAKRPRPVRERPIQKALLVAISGDRMPVILAPDDYAHWLTLEL